MAAEQDLLAIAFTVSQEKGCISWADLQLLFCHIKTGIYESLHISLSGNNYRIMIFCSPEDSGLSGRMTVTE